MNLETKALITTEDLTLYKNLFDKNSSPKSMDRLCWMHLKNPIEKNFIDADIDVENENAIAALYAVFPVKIKIGDQVYASCQSIDTMTDEKYRGLGLFVKLAKSVYNRCTENGLKLVYGFPNSNSAKGFFKHLGWKNIAEVPFLIKPLQTKYFSNKIIKNSFIQSITPNIKVSFFKKIILKPSYTIKLIQSFSEEFDYLWTKFSNDIPVAVNRDSEYLNWRISQKPDEEYLTQALYYQDRLVAFIIYIVKDKHEGKVGYIMDFIYEQEHEEEAQKLLKVANNYFIHKTADVVLVWCFEHSKNYLSYKKNGFFKLPDKMRPIKLFFGFGKLNDTDNCMELENPKSWYLSYLDSDTV